jgi:SAM-dependent methyltransferase
VLDLGCGPGRHVRALAARGLPALGIELHAGMAQLAARRGAPVLVASVFDPLPGLWGTALLLDGSLGIGGDVVRLLRRVRELLYARGTILVELDPPPGTLQRRRMRLHGAGLTSRAFWWASIGADAIDVPAGRAGLHVAERWTLEGRWFARLV